MIQTCKICGKTYKVKNEGQKVATDYDKDACESCNMSATW